MKKITLLITLLFALARTVMGQTVQPATPAADSTARTVTGIIIDEQHQPIELANVALLSADSTFLQGTCTDDDGASQGNINFYAVHLRRLERILYVMGTANKTISYMQGFNEIIIPFY